MCGVRQSGASLNIGWKIGRCKITRCSRASLQASSVISRILAFTLRQLKKYRSEKTKKKKKKKENSCRRMKSQTDTKVHELLFKDILDHDLRRLSFCQKIVGIPFTIDREIRRGKSGIPKRWFICGADEWNRCGAPGVSSLSRRKVKRGTGRNKLKGTQVQRIIINTFVVDGYRPRASRWSTVPPRYESTVDPLRAAIQVIYRSHRSSSIMTAW